MKRLLLILAFLIVLLGVAVGIYFFLFAPSAPHLTVNNSGNPFTSAESNAKAGTQPATQVGVSVNGAGTAVAPNLVQITKNPVAVGVADFDVSAAVSTSGSSTVSTSTDVKVRYIDRESGNVYEYGAISRTLTRLSDKTLPGVQEASWVADGSLAFARLLSTTAGQQILNTYALPANGQGGYFLAQNLAQAAVIGSSTLFTLAAGTDSSIGTLSKIDGSSPSTLFSSHLTEFTITAAKATYIAVTRATASLYGYAFLVHGGFTPILGPYNGLTALISPSGKQLLYSYLDSNNTMHMAVLSLTDGSSTPIPVATITDKCVWTADSLSIYCGVPTAYSGTIPDDWYQGATSFSDRIWKIDLNSRLATLVLDPTTDVKNGVDAIGLAIDPNAQVLVFTNKKDLSLWAFSL